MASAAMRPAVSVVSLFLGVLVKYIPLMFGPALLIYLWRTRRGLGPLTFQVLVGLFVGFGVAAVLYLPLWEGAETFKGLAERGLPVSSASPMGALNWLVMRTPLRSLSAPLTLALITVPALAFMLWASIRVRDIVGLGRAFAQVC